MIEDIGINPDVEISFPANSKEDTQLNAAIEQLNFQINEE